MEKKMNLDLLLSKRDEACTQLNHANQIVSGRKKEVKAIEDLICLEVARQEGIQAGDKLEFRGTVIRVSGYRVSFWEDTYLVLAIGPRLKSDGSPGKRTGEIPINGKREKPRKIT